jgi:hypothetical protein
MTPVLDHEPTAKKNEARDRAELFAAMRDTRRSEERS